MKHLVAFSAFITASLFANAHCPDLTGTYQCAVGCGVHSETFTQTTTGNVTTYEERLSLESGSSISWTYVADGKERPYKHLNGEVSSARAECMAGYLQIRVKSKFVGVADGGMRFIRYEENLTVLAGRIEGTKFDILDQYICRKVK